MMPKIGNNNNNTISINFFLNEQCKCDEFDRFYKSVECVTEFTIF